MTQRIPESFSAAEWRHLTITDNRIPPRDPDEDEEDEDDEDQGEDRDDESPVVREPDED
jgi:hypothetical protein